MKQKRKVKSLFPQKQKDYTLLITAILLILSLILCIGTAALITSFVGASDDNSEAQPYTFDYDGIQNKAETLYGIRFVDPSNISKAINNIFIERGNLYISPNPVIVNPAKDNGEGIDRNINQNFGKQSHILGGKGNLLSGSNTTIIAGKDNKIELGQMLAVLGGSGNKLHSGGVVGNPKQSLLIGGEGNESYGAVAHLGGKNNKSRIATDSFIIGGENNHLNQLGGKSVIIGGKHISVTGVSNIFAYSNGDSTFTPQTSNAFYLNMEKGVGVNTTGGDKGLYVSGAVYIGDIDISSKSCTSSSYGVIGSYKGCLVGCTKASSEEIKWEMLDLGAKCKEICDENDKCITTTDINTANNEENKIYTDAQCTNNVNTGYASICSRDENFTGGYLEFYKNVIFETVLLDSDQPCPVNPENQCIYKCNPGYHLTGNVADGSLKCYKDCDLPWNNKIKKKHNETIIAYNITGVSCSNDIYLFPFETRIINKGVPKLSPTNPVLNIQNGKATNGYSPETCGNYEHKKTLICQKGEWFLVGDNDKAILNTQELAKNYKYESCNLSSYSCDSSYNLTKATITGDRKDTISQWTTIDRGTQNGTRAQYEMCKNYNVNPNPAKNGETCNEGEYRYKFIKCQNGYHTGEGYENVCMKDCTLKNRDGTIKSYENKAVVTGYVNNTETCTGTCQAANLFCDDGTWKLGSMNGNVDTGHTYNDCVLNAKTCNAYTYNVTYDEYLSGKAHSYYSTGCESYVADGKFACTFTDIRYQLIRCQLGYHTENNKRCVEDVKLEECEAKPAHSTWIESSCYNGSNGDKCTYQNIWTGGWKSSLGGGWNKLYDPDPHCESTCDEGYSYSDDECTKDKCRGTGPTGDNIIKSNAAPRWNFLTNRTWKYSTGSEEDIKNGSCLWGCKDGYHRLGNTCEFDEKTVNCLTGGAIPEHSDYVVTGVTVTWDSVQNTWNPTPACTWKCNEPGYVLNEVGTGCVEKPSCPAGKYMEDGVCEFTPPGTYSPEGDINKYNCPTGKHSNAVSDSIEDCRPYEDLDVYVVGANSNVESYSLMDRNLGATEVYNGDIDHPNTASYGYHYQWGNNYGFLPCLGNGCTVFPNGETLTQTPVTNINSKYIPSKYINNVYIYADHYLANRNNLDSAGYNRIKNLWGGNTEGNESKQGPCPAGYHVPSSGELQNLDTLRRSAHNISLKNVEVEDNIIDEFYKTFWQDILMPPAGHRSNGVHGQGITAEIFSSSIKNNPLSDPSVYGLSEGGENQRYDNNLSASVRCIKNTKNKRTTIHPNGGTGAVISIVGGKIQRLGTPTKGDEVFQGWYSDSSFTKKVQTGDQAPQHLYAKWKSDESLESVTYLIPGPDINQSMRDITTWVNRDNIKYFKRSTVDKHEDYAAFNEIQIPDKGYPEVYLWYDPDDKTIYYYTDATTIYMNPDSSRMFYGFGDADTSHFDYGRLEDIDLSDINTSEVENMSRMFELCRNLKSIKLGPDFDTSNVTDMSYMFSSCSSLTNTGLDLTKFDTINVVDMSSMFAGCSSIKHLNLSQYGNFKTDNAENMQAMFAGGPELTCNSLSKFNTSKVENMSMMFQGTQSKSLDLTSFDTNKVTNMSSMFANSNLTTVDLTSFDTSIVVNMDSMFGNSTNLTTIYASESFKVDSLHSAWNCPDDGRNCSSVGNKQYWANRMFAGCVSLSTPYTSFSCEWAGTSWNTDLCQGAFIAYIGSDDERDGLFTAKDDNVGDFCAGAVDNAAYLISGPEINAEMIRLAGGAENIKSFENNAVANEIPSSGTVTISSSTSRRKVIMWYDSSHKTIYYYTDADKIYMNPDSSKMFEGLYNLSNFDIVADKKWDTSKVKNMSHMFYDCGSLVADSIDPLKTWDISNVEDMSSMFQGCINLSDLSPLSEWNTSSVIDISSIFSMCYEHQCLHSDTAVDFSSLSNWDTSKVKNMSSLFEGIIFMDDQITFLSGWNTSNVEDMSYMFYSSDVKNAGALGNWDVGKVRDMSHMFDGCSSLEVVRLERNTNNVENMNSMFKGCSLPEVATKETYYHGLDVLLSGWDTSKVKDMSSMFSFNGGLKYVELNGLDTSSVENMSSMFNNCISLEEVNINLWDTSSVEDMSNMFAMCTALETLNLNNRDTSSVKDMRSMFLECNNEYGQGCSKNLKTIYASEYFVTDNVSDSENMFYGTLNLEGGNHTKYDVSHRNKEYARIDKAGQKGYFTYKSPTPINGVCGTKPYTCESGKLNFSNYGGPLLNRYYTGGETPYISGYQWDCEGVFSGDTVTGCFTCGDDDYYRCDGNINGYACDINTCAAKHYTFKCFMRSWSNYDEVKDNCTIKNRNNILICTNEKNQSCSDNYKACCVRTKDVYYKDYYTENPSGTQEYDNNVGPKVEYKPLYEYQAYVGSDDKEQKVYYESIIPIKYDLGKWIYGTYKSSHGYREELFE